jgi:DNA-binding SARP family transcriptional activator
VTSLELRLFGSLLIHQDGAVVDSLKSKKGQALLCYLAVTGQPWSRPALAGLFWPDMPEANALINLRKALHLINQQLASHLLVSRQTIAFNQTASTWLDVAEFEARVTRKADAADLQRAVDLYRDDFLGDLYLPDCEVFEEWAAARRVGLRQLALDALARLAEQELQQANYESAERHRAATAGDRQPARTRSPAVNGSAGLAGGSARAALQQYEMCRQILAIELAVDPAPATARLAGQIRQNQLGQLTIGTPARRQHRRLLPKTGQRPPPIPTIFSWRPRPWSAVKSRWRSWAAFWPIPPCAWSRWSGPAGIGKSSLALAIAAQERERFPHGVFVVELAPAGSADKQRVSRIRDLLVARIADAMGYQLQDERRDTTQQLLDYLLTARFASFSITLTI